MKRKLKTIAAMVRGTQPTSIRLQASGDVQLQSQMAIEDLDQNASRKSDVFSSHLYWIYCFGIGTDHSNDATPARPASRQYI